METKHQVFDRSSPPQFSIHENAKFHNFFTSSFPGLLKLQHKSSSPSNAPLAAMNYLLRKIHLPVNIEDYQ
jgi:hypothetical protein